MRVHLLIGPGEAAVARLRRLLGTKSGALAKHGIAAPDWSPARLYLACSDPEAHGALRFARGVRTEAAQRRIGAELRHQLAAIAGSGKVETLVLACGQLGRLMCNPGELERLRELLDPVAEAVRVTIHVEEQARLLAALYPDRVIGGRIAPLDQELALAASGVPWWDAALARKGASRPYAGLYPHLEGPPAWLDFEALAAHWQAAFGTGAVALRGWAAERIDSSWDTLELETLFGIEGLGRAAEARGYARPSGATVARMRALNPLLLRYAAKAGTLATRQLRQRFAEAMAVEGAPVESGSLAPVSERFRAQNARLVARDPALEHVLRPAPPLPVWQEPDPGYGFRATQYLAAFVPMLERNGARIDEMKAADRAEDAAATEVAAGDGLSPAAQEAMPTLARLNLARIRNSPFAPHNALGAVDEETQAAPFAPAPPRRPPEGSSGTVVVACMKNEAPYILEWIAHHRAIGVDRFLIYTNDCEDGTDAILDRLQAMGVVEHRANAGWRGRSPQQHALNLALEEPVVRQADWLIHIDIDEFINVRCGNGTLDDFRARVPDATHVAMTWRLFGHGGVTRLEDRFVIEQFEDCAPRFCPKPHTAWGYKTMFRNIGAYEKMSCHRPTRLRPERAADVRWVNGSGHDITAAARDGGWRSSKSTIGYELLQLNHYALRSAESFLVKRDRGRALHVDRRIGLNYWIRMDWTGARDVTIQRNLPRLRAGYDRLLADPELARLHAAGFAWHRAKAEALHALPEFEELYRQALGLRLTETERVAFALALDMES